MVSIKIKYVFFGMCCGMSIGYVLNYYFLLQFQMLKNLILMPNIYATREFQQEREKTARENLQWEIESLQG